MRKTVTKGLFCTACGCLLLAAATAGGQEPQPPGRRVECQIDLQWPIAGNLSYLKEVLEQIGKSHEQQAACQAAAASGKVLIVPDFAAPCLPGACPPNSCPSGAPCAVSECCKCCPAACRAASCCAQGTCQVAARAGCACGDCACGQCQCGDCPCRPAVHTAGKCQRDRFWERLVEISAEKAALEAALEAHTSFAEERNDMFSTLAELMTENAKYAAKNELQADRDELVNQLHEVTAQNALLKASAELADARSKLVRESLELTLQNERLQLRVAELERQAGSQEPERTARPAKGTKRVR